MSGFKGGRRLLIGDVRFGPKGGIYFSGRNGQYSRGIQRLVSPDGIPYPKLKNGKYHADSTLRMKKAANSPHSDDRFVLRDKDDLMNKFTYRVFTNSVHAGYFGRPDLNEKSNRLENGGSMYGDVTTPRGGGKRVRRLINLTPRPHRGIQPEVFMVIRALIRGWAEKQKGKKI